MAITALIFDGRGRNPPPISPQPRARNWPRPAWSGSTWRGPARKADELLRRAGSPSADHRGTSSRPGTIPKVEGLRKVTSTVRAPRHPLVGASAAGSPEGRRWTSSSARAGFSRTTRPRTRVPGSGAPSRWSRAGGPRWTGARLVTYLVLDRLVDDHAGPAMGRHRRSRFEGPGEGPRLARLPPGGTVVPSVMALPAGALHRFRPAPAVHQREILLRLARGRSSALSPREQLPFLSRDVYDHASRLAGRTWPTKARDMLGSVLEAHLSMVSNRPERGGPRC